MPTGGVPVVNKYISNTSAYIIVCSKPFIKCSYSAYKCYIGKCKVCMTPKCMTQSVGVSTLQPRWKMSTAAYQRMMSLLP